MQLKSFLGILFLISSCQGPSSPAPGPTRSVFKTTDPSRLYFNNVRSYYYQRLEQPGKAEHFQLRQWPVQDSVPQLIPRIVNHWLRDEAYLFLHPNPAWERAGLPLQLTLTAEGEAPVTLRWAATDTLTQQRLALWLFGQINKDQNFSAAVPTGSDSLQVWADPVEQRAFRITLADYLHLTEKKPE